MSCQHYVTTCI